MTVTQMRDPQDDFERQPPNDLAAEQITLGCLLGSKLAISEVAKVIKPLDYWRPAHQIIAEAIGALHEAGKPTDPVAVSAYLTSQGEIAKVGGAPYLHTCLAAVPSMANAVYYARIVRCMAILRGLIEICTRGMSKGYSKELDLAEGLVHHTRMELDQLLADHAEGEAIEAWMDMMLRVYDDLTHNREVTGLATGFADLDALLGGGLRGGQLVCIGARPALGKSTLLLDLARHMAFRQRAGVQFHSLEMHRGELIRKMIAAEAHVPLHNLVRGGDALTEVDWTRIEKHWSRMASAQFHLIDNPYIDVPGIKLQNEELARAGQRPAAIFLDYLQLLGSPPTAKRRSENRQVEVSDQSRGLKLLAKELDVPVIFAAQLNRGPESRADHRPLLADLRESGSVEQDTDIVLLLHREDAYERESPRAGEADFIVAKHRNGPTATITTAFQGHYSRFVDMAHI